MGNRFNGRRCVHSISAITGSHEVLKRISDLPIYHINGFIHDIPDNVVFSVEEYGDRLNYDDPIYDRFRKDFATSTFIFIGSELDEPSLWKYISQRRPKSEKYGIKEMRPRSFIILPGMARAKQEILAQYNVKFIPMKTEQFAKQVLEQLSEQATETLNELLSNRHLDGYDKIQTVSALIGQAQKTPRVGRKFLLGRQPYWEDIISHRSIERHFESEWVNLISNTLKKKEKRIYFIVGTAGDGKTTSLMNIMAHFSAEGIEVGWISSEDGIKYSEMSRLILNSQPLKILIIDHAELIKGELVTSLLTKFDEKLLQTAIIIIRSSKVGSYIDQVPEYSKQYIHELNTQRLNDSDINFLIELLKNENMLGKLNSLSPQERIEIFRDKADRQILVAMIEATQGKDFSATIRSEYIELQEVEKYIYCLISVSSTINFIMSQMEIVSALANLESNDILNSVADLSRRGLLIPKGNGCLIRHRHIAQVVRDNLKEDKQLNYYYFMLARMSSLALLNIPGNENKSRMGRLLRHCINHKIIIESLGIVEARSLLNKLEQLLSGTSHYWLQRASLEAEDNDLTLAKMYIEKAFSIQPKDSLIITTKAYIDIKLGILNFSDTKMRNEAESAFSLLKELVDNGKEKDAHVSHIIGSQGLAWSRKTNYLFDSELKLWLEDIQSYIGKGRKKYPMNSDLKQLQDDVTREILMLTIKK